MEEGIDNPSYWGKLDMAMDYAKSWESDVDQGIIIAIEFYKEDFKANMLVAACLYDNSEIEAMPDEDDLQLSLNAFEGIVAHEIMSAGVIVRQ